MARRRCRMPSQDCKGRQAQRGQRAGHQAPCNNRASAPYCGASPRAGCCELRLNLKKHLSAAEWRRFQTSPVGLALLSRLHSRTGAPVGRLEMLLVLNLLVLMVLLVVTVVLVFNLLVLLVVVLLVALW